MCINKTESMLDRMKVSWQFNMSIDVWLYIHEIHDAIGSNNFSGRNLEVQLL